MSEFVVDLFGYDWRRLIVAERGMDFGGSKKGEVVEPRGKRRGRSEETRIEMEMKKGKGICIYIYTYYLYL